jgi:hypothetical protein
MHDSDKIEINKKACRKSGRLFIFGDKESIESDI